MVPDTMENYFLGSTGAGAALVGLIFVAISLWPKERVGAAPPNWRAVAGGAFFALINAFFVSLCALNPSLNFGWPILIIGLMGLVNSILLGIPLFKRVPDWKKALSVIIANRVMVFMSLITYTVEGYFGIRLLLKPDDAFAVGGIAIVLICVYALGLIRAWELLGIEQIGLRSWLNPLQPTPTKKEHKEEHISPVE